MESLKDQISRLELLLEEREAVFINMRQEKDNIQNAMIGLNAKNTVNKKQLQEKIQQYELLINQIEGYKADKDILVQENSKLSTKIRGKI